MNSIIYLVGLVVVVLAVLSFVGIRLWRRSAGLSRRLRIPMCNGGRSLLALELPLRQVLSCLPSAQRSA